MKDARLPVASAAAGLLLAAGLMLSDRPAPWRNLPAFGLALLIGSAAVRLLLQNRRAAGKVLLSALPFALPILLLLGWTLIQALNPTHAPDPDRPWALPRALEPVAWLPGSFSASRTLEAAGLLGAGMLAFFFARALVTGSAGAARSLAAFLVLGAAGVAGLCITQRIEPRPFPVFPRTGTFVNENQFAAAMNLVLPLALWLAFDFRRRARRDGVVGHPGPLFLICAALLSVSVFLTSSRAGMAVCGGVLLLFLSREWRLSRPPRPEPPVRARFLMPVLLLLFLAAAGWGIGLPAFRAREAALREQIAFRARLCEATLKIHRDHPRTGVGLGTFASVFPFYQPDDLRGRFRHAHCEPVQLLAESGVPGVLAAMFAVAGGCWGRRGGPGAAGRRFAGRLAACGLLAHALLDFPLRDTGILLVFFATLAFAGGSGPARHPAGTEEEQE